MFYIGKIDKDVFETKDNIIVRLSGRKDFDELREMYGTNLKVMGIRISMNNDCYSQEKISTEEIAVLKDFYRKEILFLEQQMINYSNRVIYMKNRLSA